ncbi:two-component system sensor histidine kinase DesK [Lipingzhangella halophila]|uniref:Two-component system sensor histidine kinase DesK n=1 Tax=Lipingzhangella halophila TaxID=1783352 RepID=A0A7W7RK37_9ACTN|nr:histidine kinase [Lipingzhangella halophila]MBB4933292.1 two-component system sensor histidine kinase DesK [Lipingzhangella halophila]
MAVGRDRHAADMAPRLANAITVAVFLLHATAALQTLFVNTRTPVPHDPASVAVAVALLGTLFALQLLQTRWVDRPERRTAALLVLAVQAGLVYLPAWHFAQAWVGLHSFLLGTALLVLRGPLRWLAVPAVLAGDALHQALVYYSPQDVGYGTVYTLTSGLVIFGVSRLGAQVAELSATRDELARGAVALQRAEFVRDIHATLGDALTSLVMRGELARRLLAGHPQQVQRELAAMRTAGRRGLAEARKLARGYRDAPPCATGSAPTSQRALLRPAWALLVAVLVGFLVSRQLSALQFPNFHTTELVVGTACMAGLVALHPLQVSWAGRPSRQGGARLALAAQAALAALPVLAFQSLHMVLANVLAASALFALPHRIRRSAFAAVVACVGLLGLFAVDTAPLAAVNYVIIALNGGLSIYGISRLLLMVSEVQELRRELAETAQAAERLRLGRDLHDLLGYSLSTVALKLDLAHRLATTQPDRALCELDQALSAARAALGELGTVAEGHRGPSLQQEYATVRDTLRSAGIAVRLRTEQDPLPAPVEATLAFVLREATTNLLRHSTARRARLTVRKDDDGSVTAELANDGASASPGEPAGGLANLTHRATEFGGTLHTHHTGGWFRLTVRIPLAAAEPSGPHS